MEMQTRDYREILRSELVKRQDKNASYSLRAFSKFLGVNPTTLSLVLQKKRGLSERSIHKITSAFQLDPVEAQQFRAMVLAVDGETPEVRLKYMEELDRYQTGKGMDRYFELSLSAFKVIAEWYNLAVLEVLDLESYMSVDSEEATSWIAARLDITLVQAEEALSHLSKLGLIERKEGKPFRTEGILRTGDKTPAEAIRSHHRQYIEKSLEALRVQEFQDCDFSGIVVPVDSTKIPKAKKLIREFRKKMNHFLRGRNTEVYRLSVSFFKLTKEKRK